MSGLMMLATISTIKFADDDKGWDTLVFETEEYDDRVGKNMPAVQTALIPTSSKEHIKQFRANEGKVCIVPLTLRKAKNGSSFLMVTGGCIEPTQLLTMEN